MNIEMTFDNVLLKHHTEDVSQGGIILPQDRQMRDQPIGDVVAVGPNVREIKAGDVVYFGTYAGNIFDIGDEEYMVLKEADIIAVII